MLRSEPRIVNIFWAHCPISPKHLFLDPHLITYHSNTNVHIIVVLDLGMSSFISSSSLDIVVYITPLIDRHVVSFTKSHVVNPSNKYKPNGLPSTSAQTAKV